MHGYLTDTWVLLKGQMKDAFRHTDAWVYWYMISYIERLCSEQLQHGIVGLKVYTLAYNNISRIMINPGVLGKYSQVELSLGGFPNDLGANGVLTL